MGEKSPSNPYIMKKSTVALWAVAIVLLIAVGALGWLLKSKTQRIVEQTTLINNLTDTVTIFKNKDSLNVAKIGTLQTSKTKDFLAIKSKDATIIKLQDIVKQNEARLGPQGSVTIFDTQTDATATVKTVVEETGDTVKDLIDTNKTYVYPTYKAQIELGKWVNVAVLAARDSTTVDVGIFNEYSLVIGEEPIPGTGFLGIRKKYKPFSEVTNLNPYSQTKTLRTYNIKQLPAARKRISLGVQIGYDPIHKQPYAGAGIQYNILNLF